MIKKESGFKAGDKIISSEVNYTLTKEELTEIRREAFRAGWYIAATYEHPAFLEESVFVKAFSDYLSSKSKEGE